MCIFLIIGFLKRSQKDASDFPSNLCLDISATGVSEEEKIIYHLYQIAEVKTDVFLKSQTGIMWDWCLLSLDYTVPHESEFLPFIKKIV